MLACVPDLRRRAVRLHRLESRCGRARPSTSDRRARYGQPAPTRFHFPKAGGGVLASPRDRRSVRPSTKSLPETDSGNRSLFGLSGFAAELCPRPVARISKLGPALSASIAEVRSSCNRAPRRRPKSYNPSIEQAACPAGGNYDLRQAIAVRQKPVLVVPVLHLGRGDALLDRVAMDLD